MQRLLQSIDRVRLFQASLPPAVRAHLHARGLSDAIIMKFELGWNGSRITIPIYRQDGSFAYFRLAAGPESEGPKMLSERGATAELYGWENVRPETARLVICEGEFDRLVLETMGFPSVTSTAGALVFRSGWVRALAAIPELFICFDNDETGRKGSARIARLLPHANVVTLPDEVGQHGDISDYFVRLGKGTTDFEALLAKAVPMLPVTEVPDNLPVLHAATRELDCLKQGVPLLDIVAATVWMKRSGRNWVGRCPFHSESSPSFTVFPKTQSYYCFGCGAAGDAITFLRKSRKFGFGEAVDTLRNLASR